MHRRIVSVGLFLAVVSASAGVHAQSGMPNHEPEPETATPQHGRFGAAEASRGIEGPEVLEILDTEPELRDVRAAALRFFSLHDDAVQRLRTRLRAKASTPVLVTSSWYQRLHADNRMVSVAPTGGQFANTSDDYALHRGRSVVGLGWDLPSAVFTPSQIQAYVMEELQRSVYRTINRAYFVRRQLMLTLLMDPPTDERALIALRLRISGFTTILDTYTGGWFSEQLPEQTARISAPTHEETE